MGREGQIKALEKRGAGVFGEGGGGASPTTARASSRVRASWRASRATRMEAALSRAGPPSCVMAVDGGGGSDLTKGGVNGVRIGRFVKEVGQ